MGRSKRVGSQNLTFETRISEIKVIRPHSMLSLVLRFHLENNLPLEDILACVPDYNYNFDTNDVA